MIINNINNRFDVLALMLTNTYFWAVGMPQLREWFVKEINNQQMSDWAGDRIICMGDNNEDLPPKVFTTSELANLKLLRAKKNYKTL